MARRKYVPSGKSDPGALLKIALITVVAGVIAGLALGFVSQWLSLLLIFPAILGGVVGGVGAAKAKSWNVRQPIAVGLIGLAAGLLAESSLHLMKYFNVRSEIASVLQNDPSAADYLAANGTSASVDAVFSGETGKHPFLGYLDMAAENGVTISKAGSSSGSKPTLTGMGVYALWLINFLIVCGIAIGLLVAQARQPFCENCTAWYDVHQTFANGAGDKATIKQAVLRLDGKQYAEAARNLGTTDGKSASVLTLFGCSKCNLHEPLLELTRVTGLNNNKPANAKVFATLIHPTEAAQLREATRPG